MAPADRTVEGAERGRATLTEPAPRLPSRSGVRDRDPVQLDSNVARCRELTSVQTGFRVGAVAA